LSLDYPFYKELKRRSHPAARWWRLGDTLYYVGLLPGMLALFTLPISLLGAVLGHVSWPTVGWTLLVLLGGVAVFIAGALLKGRSYRLAQRDGIDVNDY